MLTMIAMGLGFQVPVAILAAVRLGITTPEKLRKNRRYAILVIAIVAAFLPTIDPVTLILEMIPLILLYELSIVLAPTLLAVGRRRAPSPPAPRARAPLALRPPCFSTSRASAAAWCRPPTSTLAILMGGGPRVLRHRQRRAGRPLRRLLRAGGGGDSGNSALEKRIEKNEKKVSATPRQRGRPQGAGARLLPAGRGADLRRGRLFPAEAKDDLRKAAANWQRLPEAGAETGRHLAGATWRCRSSTRWRSTSPRRPRRRPG